jgi:hypothetical protein
MTEQAAIEFRDGVLTVLDLLIRNAVERGSSTDQLYRRLSVEALELAARMYDGNDDSFLHMAQRMLALVRTGHIEQ